MFSFFCAAFFSALYSALSVSLCCSVVIFRQAARMNSFALCYTAAFTPPFILLPYFHTASLQHFAISASAFIHGHAPGFHTAFLVRRATNSFH